MMLLRFLALALSLSATPLSGSELPAAANAKLVADEAVAVALSLPPGYKRDVVLRAISRNLRWFGQHEAGVRAARAMTDNGKSEVPLGAGPSQPRYVPLREALPTGSPCDAGIWRKEGGGEAATPRAREAWARDCLLERDFHWMGLPEGALVRAVAADLPAGETKASVLAMLIRSYGDADTLRFVESEFKRDGSRLPTKARAALAQMLAEPTALYRLGRKGEALAAARSARTFEQKAEMIRQLIGDNDAGSATLLFETLGSTPPEFSDDCFQWFSSFSGLSLARLGNARSTTPALGAFLDQLPGSTLYRRICPKGMPVELETEHLLSAGRLDAAITRARSEPGQPFLLVDALLQVGQVRFRDGDREAARAHALAAAEALPVFDRGDPVNPNEANSMVINMDAATSDQPGRNFGERPADTGRRLEVIRLLAATGAVREADALARKQLAGALRAVALSASVAGRAGMRFDDQAPTPDWIAVSDL